MTTGVAKKTRIELSRSRENVLEEYVFLRSQGISNEWMHQSLRMARKVFEDAMRSAIAAGDPRALEWKVWSSSRNNRLR